MYDKPLTVSYSFGEIDIADAAEVLSIKGPAGATGILRDIAFSASETFNAVTTEAFVRIGTAADPDAYAELGLGTLADTDSIAAAESDYTQRRLPADTQVEVTTVANTGGTPAGKGYLTVTIDWDVAQPDPHPTA